MRLFLIALLFVGSAYADECPAPPDYAANLEELIAEVQKADNEAVARAISNKMWVLWAEAPDEYSQELLDEGMSRRNASDYSGAIKALDELVKYCPDYAEGYNQRAFVNFLRREYKAALPDLERTLELSPHHIAAMAGQALTLMALERTGEALVILRRALKLNPWLGERHLLSQLENMGEEI
ncbi:MAG: hypothetical protein OXC72_01710 [Roseovarius sp.]|nr:hypothetical protein [Roseovarius sp.]